MEQSVEQQVKRLRGKNVIVRLHHRPAKKNVGTVNNPIMVDNEGIYFPSVTIMAVGQRADPNLKVGMVAQVFVQALGHPIDNEDHQYGSKDKENKHFLVFDDQIDAIIGLESDHLENETEV